MRVQLALLSALLALAIGGGCVSEENDWDTETLTHGYESVPAQVLKRGREAYARYCVGCHGENGDGEGPAARFLNPKPRDFRVGKIKFAEVPAGELPRDEDLLAVITHGLDGTSMPSWKLLSRTDRLAIVAYIKTFSEAYAKKSAGVPVAVGKDPWRRRPEQGIAEGERVYHGIAGCYTCHAAYVTRKKMYEHLTSYDIKVDGFRDALYEPIAKDSQWGEPIKPPDFLTGRIKTGYDKDRMVRIIAAGVGGTAMPTWAGGLTDRQLWGLAYYVETLALMRGSAKGAALRKELANQAPFEIPAPPPPPPPAADAGPAATPPPTPTPSPE